MKINVDIDLTPEEFRKLMGWPDVESFQNKLLDQIGEQMDAGAEGYDPLSLLKPFMVQSVGAMDMFQKFMGSIMTQYGKNNGTEKDG